MVRKPANPYASKSPKAPKPFMAPGPRNMLTERALGGAIADKLIVALTYEGDRRSFAPHVVWETEAGNVVVHGIQTSSSDPFGKNGPHTFTVCNIDNLAVTAERFTKDPAFDARKYRERVLYIIKD